MINCSTFLFDARYMLMTAFNIFLLLIIYLSVYKDTWLTAVSGAYINKLYKTREIGLQ